MTVSVGISVTIQIEEAANYYGGSPIAAKLQFENNKGQILRAA